MLKLGKGKIILKFENWKWELSKLQKFELTLRWMLGWVFFKNWWKSYEEVFLIKIINECERKETKLKFNIFLLKIYNDNVEF